MSQPLVRSQRVVESRLRSLGQKLNDELGFRDQRLRFTQRVMRSGPTTWLLQNQQLEIAAVKLPQGSVAELAAAGDDESILYFAYNEEWQPARGRDQIEFVSSNLRFVIAGLSDTPDLRFRLEWAGAKTDKGVIGYPGVGAAHPHWQFDVDPHWMESVGMRANATEPKAIEIDLEPSAETIDLEAGDEVVAATPTLRISAALAGFHHLHLPARTMWHDLACIMPDLATPQQHTPASGEEIDRWVVSALRYLRSEFQRYV